ncbi:MAG TPA: hypothetical protein VFF72_03045, partial [Caldimonas sp.]|nr:hypothetical protein [Caldimonas sp.]
TLETVIARVDPAYSGALAVGTGNHAARGAFGRSPAIPASARSLGGGRSAWKPTPASPVVLVFDDASGQVVAQCAGVTTAMRDLVADELTGCVDGHWFLLSGTVRFSAAIPPVANDANSPSLPFSVALAMTGGGEAVAPQCVVEAMKTVRRIDDGGLHLDAVDVAATPQSEGFDNWEDTGERFAVYHCVVAPRADGRWSGRSTLAPLEWSLGTSSTDWRVCRFAVDRDGSGAIDANIEHPADYHDVDTTLNGQNFLVVHGDQDCPVAAAGDPLAEATNTVPHQP